MHLSQTPNTKGVSTGQQLPSPVVAPLDDNQQLVVMLSELLGESVTRIRQRLYAEELCMGKHHCEEFKEFGAPPHVWSDQMAAYYEHSRLGRISLMTWNRRREKLQMREWIGMHLAKSNRPLRILVIGDGAGFDSLYLSQCGHQVTYSELSKLAIQFAKRIFEQANAAVKLVTDVKNIEPTAYDVVVCLDVLEHVNDPESLVADMAGYLKSDGQLIVHAPFFFVSPRCPTHLRSNRRFSGSLRLFRRQGFTPFDGRPFWDPIVLVRGNDNRAREMRRSRIWRLRLTGMLLAIARVWNFAHNMLAHRTLDRVDKRWLAGLHP